MHKFSGVVQEKLGFYVYRLIDPRNGETFYVGKGKNNRVFHHARGEPDHVKNQVVDEKAEKIDRIREIRRAKLEVIHVIHRHGMSEEVAIEVEAALLDAYPGLTNIQGGHGSLDRGPMNASEIIDKYDLPEMEFAPPFNLLLININHLDDVHDRQAIYKQVRAAWPISVDRATLADFILAVKQGVAIGAYIADEWLPASVKNFPWIGEDYFNRWGFRGREASKDIWERFVGERGKRIINPKMLHIRHPLRYWVGNNK